MRDEITIKLVEDKCEVLKKTGFWLPSPKMRPQAWLNNFSNADKPTAAKLLDRFIFCNDETVDQMLKSAWQSVTDGFPKGPDAPTQSELTDAINNEICFTLISGEIPKPTDSGYYFCRKARQILRLPDDLIVDFFDAIKRARDGHSVVFLDDMVGSGDQFRSTWQRQDLYGSSFESIQKKNNFIAIYINLVTTDYGLNKINQTAPKVAICSAHFINNRSTLRGLFKSGLLDKREIIRFLNKYAGNLRPKEDYIANNSSYLKFGYKYRALLIGFEHSIPDATLPIFWSPGINNWEPLIERI